MHRVGRTGRAGRSGSAITLFTRNDWSRAGKLIDILQKSNQVRTWHPKSITYTDYSKYWRSSLFAASLFDFILCNELLLMTLLEFVKNLPLSEVI